MTKQAHFTHPQYERLVFHHPLYSSVRDGVVVFLRRKDRRVAATGDACSEQKMRYQSTPIPTWMCTIVLNVVNTVTQKKEICPK